MFYAQSTANGSYYRGETKCYIPTTTTKSDSLFNAHSTVEDLEKFGENEVEWAGKAETRSLKAL